LERSEVTIFRASSFFCGLTFLETKLGEGVFTFTFRCHLGKTHDHRSRRLLDLTCSKDAFFCATTRSETQRPPVSH
jgi:hypothetical protein